MKQLLKYSLLIFLLSGYAVTANAQVSYLKITNYQTYYASAKRNNTDWFAIRKFENEGKIYLLLVDPDELETKIDEAAQYTLSPMFMAQARLYYQKSSYEKALRKAEQQSKSIQDAGIQSGMPSETGVTLTADLCPSVRPLDRRIFTAIFEQFKKVEQPVPIALSITGIWMRQHQQDLEWLKEMNMKGEIYITWVNHSYNHRVSKTQPLKQNFLLEPGTDVNFEVLGTEQAMLKNGLLPSVFFRFPGLVSDKQLIYKIADFGLIPVGSDAWLAKGQQPQSGSIVLIHGNGNEPVGVNDFISLLKSKTKSIAKKQWLLYDLRESVETTFEGK
ncbi:MAG: polysaccharide deacetylase [Mucilaginibacter sp.]|nr:polysaccharide deacetylase [Mucilaginibacter sp.]